MDKDDVLRGVLASLEAQKANLPVADPLEEIYVGNYHQQLDLLEQVGISTSRFRVPDNQVKPIELIAGVVTTGMHEPTRYTPDKYIDRSLLLTKIDTMLNYFSLPSKGMGFRA
jgi:hypothetical protein